MTPPLIDHPIDPVPYVTWLVSLSAEEQARVNAEADILAIKLRDLLTVVRQIQPDTPLGIWLNALGRVWITMQEQMDDNLTHPTEDAS